MKKRKSGTSDFRDVERKIFFKRCVEGYITYLRLLCFHRSFVGALELVCVSVFSLSLAHSLFRLFFPSSSLRGAYEANEMLRFVRLPESILTPGERSSRFPESIFGLPHPKGHLHGEFKYIRIYSSRQKSVMRCGASWKTRRGQTRQMTPSSRVAVVRY